jgi:hypothetical protein
MTAEKASRGAVLQFRPIFGESAGHGCAYYAFRAGCVDRQPAEVDLNSTFNLSL